MKHAIEADHVMAVASLTAQTANWRQSLRHGIIWGIGHTVMLLLVSVFIFLADLAVPEKIAGILEFLVGFMLLALGGHLFIQIRKNQIHIHCHEHDGQRRHIHFHSHLHHSDHNHQHLPLWRTLYIGLIHGMAGSASLILLTLSTVDTIGTALLYVLCFGVGSIAGMGTLSVILVVPFLYVEKRLQGFHKGVQWSTCLATVAIGLYIIVENQPFF